MLAGGSCVGSWLVLVLNKSRETPSTLVTKVTTAARTSHLPGRVDVSSLAPTALSLNLVMGASAFVKDNKVSRCFWCTSS